MEKARLGIYPRMLPHQWLLKVRRNEYFKEYLGIVDGFEYKYCCDEVDGLYLIVKLFLE